MFILERLVGIGVYCYFLCFAVLLIMYTRIGIKNILIVYIVALAGMAFLYVPYKTADMYRIFETMRWYATMDFSHFFKTYVITSSVPAGRILFWIVGKSGIHSLLPVISAIINYSLIFYTVYRTQYIFSVSRENTALVLFFLMALSIYISVIGGVRMMLSVSMITFCYYREEIENRFRWYYVFFYVVSVLMHNMAWVLVGIRILLVMFDKRKNKNIKVLIATAAIGAIAFFLVKSRALVFEIIEDAYYYLKEPGYRDVWEYIMGVLIAITFLLVYKKFKESGARKKYANVAIYNKAAELCFVIGVLFCFVFTFFYRFIGHVVPIISAPMMMVTLQESQAATSTYKKAQLKNTVFILSLLLLFLSCTRGSLSSLKFFELS